MTPETPKDSWGTRLNQGGYFTASQPCRSATPIASSIFTENEATGCRSSWTVVGSGTILTAPVRPHSVVHVESRPAGNIKPLFHTRARLIFHDLGEVMPAKLHITVPKNFRKQAPDACVCTTTTSRGRYRKATKAFLHYGRVRTIKDVAKATLALNIVTKALHTH